MSHKFLLSTSFHKQLLALDLDIARDTQEKGCGYCAGKLHQAHYPRIGFGVGAKIALFYTLRFSFCCADCRRRTTAPSIRFFGSRRYVSSIFLFLCTLRLSPSERNCERLFRRFNLNVSLSTWKRWLAWWQQTFPQTQFWSIAKSRFSSPINVKALPCAILQ